VQVDGQKVILVGDRVLIRPDDGESVSRAGLILPATVADRERVGSGQVVAVGPGLATSPSSFDVSDDAPTSGEPRWVAMQARVGDLAVFHRKAAIEIALAHEKLLVVPHGAILVLLRDTPDVPRHVDPQ